MFGARCTKYQLDPAPAPRVATTRSSGSWWAPAKAMASAQARMIPAHMIWLVALVAWPLPQGPKCSIVLPMAASTGRAASKDARSPPHMMASVPFFAPSTPPLTGASTNLALRLASVLSAHFAVSALTVEQSITREPGASPGASASTTERTSASAETQITATSTSFANSSRGAGAATPSSEARAVAFSRLRFQTAVSRPALWRFLAMGAPMAPRPANPTRVIGAGDYLVRGSRPTSENAAQGAASVKYRRGNQPWGPQIASTAFL